ncbi:hypothetical protein [Actinacidiphila oryziradicis]|nr:hypothetical protein [Actinacidiphila oryziradicis]
MGSAIDLPPEPGQQEDFTAYLTTLRAGQKRERNLMKIPDRHGL